MASEKQKTYIKQLVKWKKSDIKVDVDSLSEQEASQVIDELKEIKAPKKENKKEVVKTMKKEEKLNGQRFGMCSKMVVDKSGLDWCLANQSEFSLKVKQLYFLMAKAEEVVSSSSSSSLPINYVETTHIIEGFDPYINRELECVDVN